MNNQNSKNIVNYYQRIKDLRDDHKKNQSEIAAILGTSQQQYSRWESGERELPMHHFITLAKYYNVSLDYLAGLTNQVKTLDGTPYNYKNITINSSGDGCKINIKN